MPTLLKAKELVLLLQDGFQALSLFAPDQNLIDSLKIGLNHLKDLAINKGNNDLVVLIQKLDDLLGIITPHSKSPPFKVENTQIILEAIRIISNHLEGAALKRGVSASDVIMVLDMLYQEKIAEATTPDQKDQISTMPNQATFEQIEQPCEQNKVKQASVQTQPETKALSEPAEKSETESPIDATPPAIEENNQTTLTSEAEKLFSPATEEIQIPNPIEPSENLNEESEQIPVINLATNQTSQPLNKNEVVEPDIQLEPPTEQIAENEVLSQTSCPPQETIESKEKIESETTITKENSEKPEVVENQTSNTNEPITQPEAPKEAMPVEQNQMVIEPTIERIDTAECSNLTEEDLNELAGTIEKLESAPLPPVEEFDISRPQTEQETVGVSAGQQDNEVSADRSESKYIPASMIPCLIVKDNGQPFALPYPMVERLQKLVLSDLKLIKNDIIANIDGEDVKMFNLAAALGYGSNEEESDKETFLAAICQTGSRRIGLLFDAVHSFETLKVPRFHSVIGKLKGIAGISVIKSLNNPDKDQYQPVLVLEPTELDLIFPS